MPNFAPSSVHGAIATFSNPKSVGFDYTASLCMGVDWTEMASASFHLNAGESKAVPFSVTMPATTGTYPVYFKVTSGGVIIGTFVATEDIIIKKAAWVSPDSDNAPSGWSNPGKARDGDILTYQRTVASGPPYTYKCTPIELYTPPKTCGAVKILARAGGHTTVTVEVRKDGIWQAVAVFLPMYPDLILISPVWIVITFTPGIIDAVRITPQQAPLSIGDVTFVYEVMFFDGVFTPAPPGALSYASDVRTTSGKDADGKPWFDFEVDIANSGSSAYGCAPFAKLRTSHTPYIIEVSMGIQEINPGAIATFHGYWKWTWSAPGADDWIERISIRSEAGLKSWVFGSKVQVSAFSVPLEVAAGGLYSWSLSLFLTYYSGTGYGVMLHVNNLKIYGARIGASNWTFYATKDFIMTASGVFTFTGSATAPTTPGKYDILVTVDKIDNVGNAQYAFYRDPVGKLKVV